MVNIQPVSFPRSSPITSSQPLVCHPDAQGKLINCALDAHREKILRLEEIKVTHASFTRETERRQSCLKENVSELLPNLT